MVDGPGLLTVTQNMGQVIITIDKLNAPVNPIKAKQSDDTLCANRRDIVRNFLPAS